MGMRGKGFTSSEIDGSYLYLSQYRWGVASKFQEFKPNVNVGTWQLEPNFVSSWIPKINLKTAKMETFFIL